MNFKPILFSTPMVKAILDGKKTQTRRIVKYNKNIKQPKVGFSAFTETGEFSVRGIHENGEFGESFFKLKIKTGDVLWVRETWQYSDDLDNPYLYKQKEYEELKPEYFKRLKWKPSIFMPKDSCRIFLLVTKVRIEKLQDISEDDCIAEGIENFVENFEGLEAFRNYTFTEKELEKDHWAHVADHAEHSFETLWESINGKESWNYNPWVYVYEFEQIKKPENF